VVGDPVDASVRVTLSGAGPLAGVAVKLATGAPVEVDGAALSCAVADEAKVTGEPPMNDAISGVTGVKWPVTRTVTVSPRAGVAGQGEVEHVTSTSDGATVTKLPLASFVVRHITRLASLFADVHAVPARKDVGFRVASSAPSRAASLTVICA
jgi:hypothetical protein